MQGRFNNLTPQSMIFRGESRKDAEEYAVNFLVMELLAMLKSAIQV